MARLTGPLNFTGKLQDLSAHKRVGTKGTIIRPRYGPSKNNVDTKPSYANTRRINTEFGGRSTTAQWIRNGFYPMKPFFDDRVLGRLNAVLKHIQLLDTQTVYGKRSVALSLGRKLLEGFAINSWHPFESVVSNPVECKHYRDELRATISLPGLLHGVNFHPPTAHPYFRVMATLSIIPDMHYHEIRYRPKGNYEAFRSQLVQTEWMAVKSGSESLNLEVQMPQAPPGTEFSLVLTLGIQMGTAKSNTIMEGIKYAGSGKILAVF